MISGCSNNGAVTGTGSAGGIIGENFVTVQNCINNGDVSAELEELPEAYEGVSFIQTNNFIGGIAGYSYGTISGCVNTADIAGEAQEYVVGGIAGNNSGTVTLCKNEGDLSAYYGLGGVSGENYGTVSCSVNTGNITGLTDICGIAGITGDNSYYGVLENCINCGSITAVSLESTGQAGEEDTYGTKGNAAGIAGCLHGYGSLNCCYNVGSIDADDGICVGGIIANALSEASVAGCYYPENTVSGIGNNAGSYTVTALTDAQMKLQSSYSGYDFTDIWMMNVSEDYQYPVLKGVEMNTVNSPVALSMVSEPDKVLYLVDTELDLTGAKVKLRKKFGVSEILDVTPDMVTNYNKALTGEQTLTVTYEGLSTTFKIRVVDGTPHVSYTTHVQNVGWQEYVSDGAMAGTSGKSLRLEAIKIKLVDNVKYDGEILYRTHIQNIGWEEDFSQNDETSGTSGKALRLEAIEIKLTGELADAYDVYYRVHAQNIGWMGWAKNGEQAGTAGYAYRLEGIEICLVKRGDTSLEDGKAPFQESK